MQLTWLWARNAFELGLGFEIVPRKGDSDLWKSKIQHRENCSFQRTKFHDSREEEFTFFEFAKFTRENSRWWNRFPQHTLVNQRAPIALIYDCLHQRGIGVCRKATTRGIQHHRHPMNYAFRGMLSTLLPFFSLSLDHNQQEKTQQTPAQLSLRDTTKSFYKGTPKKFETLYIYLFI